MGSNNIILIFTKVTCIYENIKCTIVSTTAVVTMVTIEYEIYMSFYIYQIVSLYLSYYNTKCSKANKGKYALM